MYSPLNHIRSQIPNLTSFIRLSLHVDGSILMELGFPTPLLAPIFHSRTSSCLGGVRRFPLDYFCTGLKCRGFLPSARSFNQVRYDLFFIWLLILWVVLVKSSFYYGAISVNDSTRLVSSVLVSLCCNHVGLEPSRWRFEIYSQPYYSEIRKYRYYCF